MTFEEEEALVSSLEQETELYAKYAKKMMGWDEIPYGLYRRLHRVAQLTRRVQGSFVSRQAVALAIMQWESDNGLL